MPTARLLALFLACFASIGYEIALARFFALSSWSEYGYWVISIAMVGLAAGGTMATLALGLLVRFARPILVLLPVLMMVAATIGWHGTTIVPFNPLELQNHQLWGAQLANIGAYYAALFPFFFLVGLYVSLVFVLHARQIGLVYAADLAGAGMGALAVLAFMLVVTPFNLVACLLPALAVAAWLEARMHPQWRRIAPSILVVFLACQASVMLLNQARVNEFKDIFGPLNTRDSKVLAEIRSPTGLYQVVDSFVERLDTDLSNNSGRLGVKGLPRAFGLYRDGNRIAGLPRDATSDAAYFSATLDSLPYLLRPGARALMLGGAGGFRLHEARAAGASSVDVVEPDMVLRRALVAGLGPAAPPEGAYRWRVHDTSPLAVAALGREAPFDVIDITREFLAQSETNRLVMSVEALTALIGMLAPEGLLSLTVSIREFPVYAVQAMIVARAALRRAGVDDPTRHVTVYRSAFNLRLLLSPSPMEPATLDAVRRLCAERSFDLVHLAGRELASVRIYNSLELVTFGSIDTAALGGADPLRLEAAAVLAGEASPFHRFMNLRPPTLDRPFFTGVLPLARLGTIIERVELVPREELPWLVNVAVLVQAVVLGLGVAALPLLVPGSFRHMAGRQFGSVLCYFACLGVGFLVLEIYLIEKASHYLQDRTFAFGFVLSAMLVFAGIGSWLSQRLSAWPKRGVVLGVLVVLAWIGLAAAGLDPLLAATAGWPLALRFLLLSMLIAPLAVALGMPMALGLGRFTGRNVAMLPWAWAINGAGSVIATPLANLVMIEFGYSILLGLAFALYVLVGCVQPASDRSARASGFFQSGRWGILRPDKQAGERRS